MSTRFSEQAHAPGTGAGNPSATPRVPGWVRSYLSRYRTQVALAVVLGVFAFGCSAFLMFTSGFLISRTAQAGVTLFMVMIPVAFVQVFGLGRPFARYFERLTSHDWVFRITSDLRLRLFRAVDGRSSDPALKKSTGEYLGLLDDDIGHLQNLYLRVVFPTVIAFALYVGASVLFGFFSPALLAVMIIAGGMCVVALPYDALLATRALQTRAKQARTSEYDSLTDDILGATDWALAKRSAEAVASHLALDVAIRSDAQKVRLVLRIVQLVSTLVLLAAICATLALAGAQFSGSEATANWIAALVLGFFPLIEVFAVLPSAAADSTTHADAISRLDEYVETGPSYGAGAKAARAADTASDAAGTARAAATDHAKLQDVAIDFQGVSYTYPQGVSPALDDVSLSIPAGQSVAVLGRSGSGKSTLASLMRGALAPDAGTVRLEGIPVGSDGLWVPAVIGFISQNPYLFDTTLRENLLFARAEATDDDLLAALEHVGLGPLVAQLEKGLDTVIGETGRRFSGGESQRIALARVLLADTPIMLLDEPFTALDPETERKLIDTVFRVAEGRTLVVITHHLAQIMRFDRVVFVEDGMIDLDGAPRELAQTSERFARLLAQDR